MEKQIILENMVQPLLLWYEKNARAMPWRATKTNQVSPYGTWVSEIMLQQTRVSAVRDYYIRFMQALPDIDALANVSEDELLKLWEGLGYYSRARNLKKAANVVMEQHNGQLPATYEALLALPGIGAYTAGAIASIAFHLPHPAVDGNVLRVVSRLLVSKEDIMDTKTRKEAERLLSSVMPKDRTSDFTQAMMELGATVCLPNGAPLCEECPLGNICLAKKQNLQAVLPVKKPKKPRTKEKRTVFLITDGTHIAIRKREKKGLLSGMWEYPSMLGDDEEDRIQKQLQEWGIDAKKIHKLPSAKHIFTHVEWHMKGVLVVAEKPEAMLWASRKEILELYALPTAFQVFTEYFLQEVL